MGFKNNGPFGNKRASELFPVRLTEGERATTAKVMRGVYEEERVKSILTRHKHAKSRAHHEAMDRIWDLGDGVKLNRYEVMEAIVILVGEGISLPDLCAQDNYPTLAETRSWFKRHPDFQHALKEAQVDRGHILGEQALLEVMNTTDVAETPLAKLKHEALSKAAARLNNDFKEKQQIQIEDVTDRMTEDQIIARIKALSTQFPELKTLSVKTACEDAEIVEGE